MTIGPSDEKPTATANVGVAAHIAAAAPGGRRYDPNMTPAQRSSIDNGIWLCGACAQLIDRDEVTYSVDTRRDWRALAVDRAKRNLAGKPSAPPTPPASPSSKKGFAQIRGHILDDPPEWFVKRHESGVETRYTHRDDLDLEIVVRDDDVRDSVEQWIYRSTGNAVPPTPAKKSMVEIRYADKRAGRLRLPVARRLSLPTPIA